MQCINCGKEFIPQRSSAKFCSPNCRITFSRKDSVTEVSVTKPETEINKPLSVTSPEVKEKVSVTTNSYRNMTDPQLLAEADLMTTRDYIARGWFGGRAVVVGGVIKDRKYFPFEEIKLRYFNWLKKEQLKSDKEIKETVGASLT